MMRFLHPVKPKPAPVNTKPCSHTAVVDHPKPVTDTKKVEKAPISKKAASTRTLCSARQPVAAPKQKRQAVKNKDRVGSPDLNLDKVTRRGDPTILSADSFAQTSDFGLNDTSAAGFLCQTQDSSCGLFLKKNPKRLPDAESVVLSAKRKTKLKPKSPEEWIEVLSNSPMVEMTRRKYECEYTPKQSRGRRASLKGCRSTERRRSRQPSFARLVSPTVQDVRHVTLPHTPYNNDSLESRAAYWKSFFIVNSLSPQKPRINLDRSFD
ncbi:uncharacterized protein LOC132720736 [Ruditapes philippinarum]|uniref:uncharacterized protein LOC132720736 n=1 Tax=Ruditapes philippinarum TaxID=129788 RepID=UPI00295AFC27|nr:uncharacterized protein LOC132720736 [Ruditapes philippinarum]